MADDDDIESLVAKAMETDLATANPPPPPRPAPAPRRDGGTEISLIEQVERAEAISSQLRDRVRQERLGLLHEFEARQTEIRIAFERELYKATVELERNRDQALKRLADEFHDKVVQYDLLVTRMS